MNAWFGPCQLCNIEGQLEIVRGLWVCEQHAKWERAADQLRLLMAGKARDAAELERRTHQSRNHR